MVKAIDVQGLTKYYRIYRQPIDRLKEIIFRKEFSVKKLALKDVSFYVLKGEAFGIIGENGAGKTTLLSIIAGINKPSAGRILVQGKVAAILELGVGFHPELTGLENIYIYAGYYGLPPKKIESKIEFIKNFSELEDFIDKPVKSYSTGMIMRLAFSTILAIEPEIFIIDEALAVGDLYFQKKVFNKIRELKEKGGTILFTSHSTYQIASICERALWLKEGQVQAIGNALDVVSAYENYIRTKVGEETSPDSEKESDNIKIRKNSNHIPLIENISLSSKVIKPEEDLEISIDLMANEELPVHIGVLFRRNDNEIIALYSTKHEGKIINLKGRKRVIFIFKRLPLLYGKYNVEVYLTDEYGNIFYDIKVEELIIEKTDFIDIGVVRIKGKIIEA